MFVIRLIVGLVLLVPVFGQQVEAQIAGDWEAEATDWVERFTFIPPAAERQGVATPSGQPLPTFRIKPAVAGLQLVRTSLPFLSNTFPAELNLAVQIDGRRLTPDVRVLTLHPGQPEFVRRAIVSFCHDFADLASRKVSLVLAEQKARQLLRGGRQSSFDTDLGKISITLSSELIEVRYPGQWSWRAQPVLPARTWNVVPMVEVIEFGDNYLWVRMLIPDAKWPRIIEVRADSLGTVAVRLHVQNLAEGDERAPEIGWQIFGQRVAELHDGETEYPVGRDVVDHEFADRQSAWIGASEFTLRFPDAHFRGRGQLTCMNAHEGARIKYLRCRADERVPHQHAAWRSATFVMSPMGAAPWTALLEPSHEITVPVKFFDAIYDCGFPANLRLWPLLADARRYHVDAMAGCLSPGDDFGNITAMPVSGVFGMNRLNHCPAIFHEYYRMGDGRLRNAALQWCSNYHDLSIWWGTTGPVTFDHRSMTDWSGFVTRMRSNIREPASPAIARVWERLDEETKLEILAISEESRLESRQKVQIAEQLNNVLKRRDLYDKTAWQGTGLGPRVESPLRRGIENLSDVDVVQLNRQLLEAVFPNEMVRILPFHRGRFGGTRYNNMARHHPEYQSDKSFMWRSNSAVSFCTKGYDSFFYAYEETGDPRMANALHWQVSFAEEGVRADDGECRNIGDVLDFVRLYRLTGRHVYLDQALRLFRELRTKLSDGDLFSQGGRPIVPNPPFINGDSVGYKYPFAKPYILGYALSGLPLLAEHCPDEPRLCNVIRAVANFMAETQDPTGGWRYPHPCSSRVSIGQGIEHAAQLTRAAAFLEHRGEPIDNLLNAIERSLQSRLLAWQRTRQFFSGLRGWESASRILKDGKSIQELYGRPENRDPSRDYTEGRFSLGNVAPEAVVYFPEVLDFYLAHRPAERLFHANPQLQAVLDRMKQRDETAVEAPDSNYYGYGVEAKLPAFREKLLDRLTWPLRYDANGDMSFEKWRATARAKLLECLLTPPPRAAFDPVVIAREDRGSYEARKLVFNVSGDCRVPAYLLVPKGTGPFPAMICLHDHGAHFLIGKEKVVRPFDVSDEILTDAERWVGMSYGGRFIGDVLAERGYVVFAMDALFWGERGQREGPDYNIQQALSSNLLQMGMTWIGVITWDDMRSTEFVASLPEVDPTRIGAVGLSMGSHRTWMLSAATDRIAAGVAICWLGTTEVLMSPGNNQAKGHSAYSMLVPNLRNWLDYPDVAAIACPKPMMFYNGDQDGLFPVKGVLDAYAVMQTYWDSEGADDRLVTKIWPRKHVFDVEMQEEAFDWLDEIVRRP